MKKFEFSFQYLLDVHRAKEQAAEYALHQSAKKLAEIERSLKTLAARREQQTAKFEKMSSGIVRRPDYAGYINSIGSIQRELASMERVRSKQHEAVERFRAALHKEVSSRRVLENLCEREHVEWAENLQREEQKQMDELAITRWGRREE